jgi:hypothetical protein
MAGIDAIEWPRKQIEETAPDPSKTMLTTMVGRLMGAEVIETWRRHCNEGRIHSTLGYLTPLEFTKRQ